jgi:hypothetical protein
MGQEKKRQTQLATVKFVSSSAKRSMPVNTVTSSKSMKTSSDSVPIRAILRDGSSSARGGFHGALGAAKKPSQPEKSQGMKATMKLLKKCRR